MLTYTPPCNQKLRAESSCWVAFPIFWFLLVFSIHPQPSPSVASRTKQQDAWDGTRTAGLLSQQGDAGGLLFSQHPEHQKTAEDHHHQEAPKQFAGPPDVTCGSLKNSCVMILGFRDVWFNSLLKQMGN